MFGVGSTPSSSSHGGSCPALNWKLSTVGGWESHAHQHVRNLRYKFTVRLPWSLFLLMADRNPASLYCWKKILPHIWSMMNLEPCFLPEAREMSSGYELSVMLEHALARADLEWRLAILLWIEGLRSTIRLRRAVLSVAFACYPFCTSEGSTESKIKALWNRYRCEP